MLTKSMLAAVSLTSLLVFSACTSGPPDSGGSADDDPPSAEPGPTATVFEQELPQSVAGQPHVIAPSTQKAGKKFRAGNVGISFETTTLADSRLEPGVSNLDETLQSLGSPALRWRKCS